MQPIDLLTRINRQHNTTFMLLERYPDGEQGAFAISDAAGQRYVLKYSAEIQHLRRFENARAITARLRPTGYPAPDYVLTGLIAGVCYSIQTALHGAPMRILTPELLPRLLKLITLHIGQAPPGKRDWPAEVVNTVLYGGNGYCLHSSLQQRSAFTRTLLSELQGLVSSNLPGGINDEQVETGDVVHFDFQHSNILAYEGKINGVIDWEGWLAGDRIFDVVTLLFYAYDDDPAVREQLWSYALARRNARIVSVYLAHLILRQVDWSLRFHDPATADRYLDRANRIIADIRQLGEVS